MDDLEGLRIFYFDRGEGFSYYGNWVTGVLSASLEVKLGSLFLGPCVDSLLPICTVLYPVREAPTMAP